jgi:sugar phosphate isomerase/epimerase
MNISGFAINADAGLIDGSLDKLNKELTYYQKLGFTFVELSPHGVGAIINGKLITKRLQEVQKVLQKYSFQYKVHGVNSLNLMNEEPDNIEDDLFRANLEFTAAIGANLLVYHAGRYCPEEKFQLMASHKLSELDNQRLWDQEQQLLFKMASIAACAGITIGIENSRPYLDCANYSYGESIAELGRMCQEINHEHIGMTLDMGHAYMTARQYGQNIFKDVEDIAPYIKHIHLHDNFGRCSASFERKQFELAATGRGDMHMPIGWGEVPARKLCSILKDYTGVITLEMRPRYRDFYGEALHNAQHLISSLSQSNSPDIWTESDAS